MCGARTYNLDLWLMLKGKIGYCLAYFVLLIAECYINVVVNLPDSIGQLFNLTKLDLIHCHLNNLSDSITSDAVCGLTRAPILLIFLCLKRFTIGSIV